MRFFEEDMQADSAYVQVKTVQLENLKNIKVNTEKDLSKENILEHQKELKDPASLNVNFNDLSADTTQLMQIYKESSLNVRIKYPPGWTYIDQNVKNKLDGVTFWASAGTYNPPPYIHLEVKEKYLFNLERFKYKIKINDNIAYFNDPEELAGQFSQTIYLRTDSDEDYSLKLIMNGKDSFYSFQPVFFGMLKTFRFGRGLIN
ncbi:MAG TPA: hypothetical protein VMT35_05075 [Ignavibacteriaceae bacterium]|nr:hypothetical protein [Ignavibacteriaceae bacterium]